MTKIAFEIQRFGEFLRDALRGLREAGKNGRDSYRRMALVFAELPAIISAMEAEGEIDPQEAESIRRALLPRIE